eukprot:SAG25_NODE_3796_length_968_cov_1.724971_1_plen_192_part_10
MSYGAAAESMAPVLVSFCGNTQALAVEPTTTHPHAAAVAEARKRRLIREAIAEYTRAAELQEGPGRRPESDPVDASWRHRPGSYAGLLQHCIVASSAASSSAIGDQQGVGGGLRSVGWAEGSSQPATHPSAGGWRFGVWSADTEGVHGRAAVYASLGLALTALGGDHSADHGGDDTTGGPGSARVSRVACQP